MAIYKELVKKISIPADKKIKQKAYLDKGLLPIVDQGHLLIGGYTDDSTKAIVCDYPVIVFGDHTKRVKFIAFPFAPGADGIKVLQPKKAILPKYLYYGTQYLTFRIEDKGYARHYQHLEKKELIVPSLSEQEQIVARIEELFSKLDKGVETLQTIKQQLVVYRQAVLKEAFEGQLTKTSPLKRDSLLHYIEKPRYGISKKCSYECADTDTPVYRIPNIEWSIGRIDHEDMKYAHFSDKEVEGVRLKKDDILIIRSNGSVSLVGRAALVSQKDTCGSFAGYLMRIRVTKPDALIPKFLLLYLNSNQARVYIENKAKSTSGVNNINSDEISQLPIPLFSHQEQVAIIDEIESRLSVCDSIEQTVDAVLAQAEALRQSILKKAFEGGFSQ